MCRLQVGWNLLQLNCQNSGLTTRKREGKFYNLFSDPFNPFRKYLSIMKFYFLKLQLFDSNCKKSWSRKLQFLQGRWLHAEQKQVPEMPESQV